MAWTNIPDTDIDVDSPFDEDLATALRDNDEALRVEVVGWYVTEQSTSSTAGANLGSLDIYVKDLAAGGAYQREIVAEFEVKVADASATGTFWIEDNATNTTSTEVTTGSTSYASSGDMTLDVDSTWKGTTRTINVWAKTSNASHAAYLQSVDRVTWRVKH